MTRLCSHKPYPNNPNPNPTLTKASIVHTAEMSMHQVMNLTLCYVLKVLFRMGIYLSFFLFFFFFLLHGMCVCVCVWCVEAVLPHWWQRWCWFMLFIFFGVCVTCGRCSSTLAETVPWKVYATKWSRLGWLCRAWRFSPFLVVKMPRFPFIVISMFEQEQTMPDETKQVTTGQFV